MPDKPDTLTLFTRTKILAFVLVTGALGCIGFLSQVYPAIFQAFELATRYGELSYQLADGQWQEIRSVDASRKKWSESDAFLQVSWQPVGRSLWYGHVLLHRLPNPQVVDLVLVRFDPEYWKMALAYQPDFAPGLVGLMAKQANMTVAINASFFSDEGPIGLLVDEGKELHAESRRWSAHLLIPQTGMPRIVNEKNVGAQNAWIAIQGFPAIMSNSKTFSYMRVGGRGFDVRAIERRSSICITHDQKVILLATDSLTNGISLSELATLSGGLGCKDAMGLDGGTSTGIVVSTPDIQRVVSNLKPVPVVLGLQPR